MDSTKLFVEIGKKRIFVGAIDWPGWCRSGRDEKLALQALIDYGPRFAEVLRKKEVGFEAAVEPSDFIIIERHEGNATTDFGAPAIMLDGDREPIDPAELRRLQTILLAIWQAFDKVVEQAAGKELRKGPRGGGRDLNKIVDHVLEADRGYLSRIAWKHKRNNEEDPVEELIGTRQAILKAIEAAASRNLPEKGPRGGIIWPARYFIRRVTWHVLDHAWEIGDRIV